MTTEKNFPNGFTSWQETHYEVVQAITLIAQQEEPYGIVAERDEAQGHGGLYELAEDLTDAFEKEHESNEWDGNPVTYWETIEAWLNEKLK
jgi:hypothetical protein